MPDSLNNDPNVTLQPLTRKEAVRGAVTSAFIGLGLFAVGLVAIILTGVLGASSGTGFSAVVIGLGCILLILPSALVLGIGIQYLRISVFTIYSLLVGKPVYRCSVVVEPRRTRDNCK